MMADGEDEFRVIVEAIVGTQHTVLGLTAGLYYKFKIESRNDAYHSDPTSEI